MAWQDCVRLSRDNRMMQVNVWEIHWSCYTAIYWHFHPSQAWRGFISSDAPYREGQSPAASDAVIFPCLEQSCCPVLGSWWLPHAGVLLQHSDKLASE